MEEKGQGGVNTCSFVSNLGNVETEEVPSDLHWL